MDNKIDELKKLLELKEQKIQTDLDKEKVDNLKFLLSQDDIFFKLEPETAVGILDYLGIEEDKIYDYYCSLISPENFREINKNK